MSEAAGHRSKYRKNRKKSPRTPSPDRHPHNAASQSVCSRGGHAWGSEWGGSLLVGGFHNVLYKLSPGDSLNTWQVT